MRPALQGGATGAYFEITNHTDAPISINSVTADFAEQVDIFQSVVENNRVQSKVLENGLLIGAGETLRLQPNGYYIGLNYLQTNLSSGDRVTLELHFSNSETISVEALVKNDDFDLE
jgi:hypothetical protein